MDTRRRQLAITIMVGSMLLGLAGCERGHQPAVAKPGKPAAVAAVPQSERLAESVLGSEAEVLAQGDLAGNGFEQVLIADGVKKPSGDEPDAGNKRGIFITRAAVLQKSGEKWTETLLCDEHLKNPYGFLEGSPLAPVTGWRFAYRAEAQGGIELLFTPVGLGTHQPTLGPGNVSVGRAIEVRWNRKTKRFQALDRSHERFLGEVPTLEIPQSVLR